MVGCRGLQNGRGRGVWHIGEPHGVGTAEQSWVYLLGSRVNTAAAWCLEGGLEHWFLDFGVCVNNQENLLEQAAVPCFQNF